MSWIVFFLLFSLNEPCAQAAGFSSQEMTIPLTLSQGPALRAKIRFPARKRAGKPIPVLLVFGGFQEAARVLDLIHTDESIALATFDYPFEPPRKFYFPGSLVLLPEVKTMIRQTHDGIASLVAKLRGLPEIDSARITILGASLGSPFAVQAAADVPGIRGLIVIHGFGRLTETAQHELERGLRSKLGWLSTPFSWLMANLAGFYLQIPPPEKVAMNLHPGQSVLFVAAKEDQFLPRAAIEDLWAGIQKSRASAVRIDTPGDHLQPGSQKLIDSIVKMATRWMKSSKLL